MFRKVKEERLLHTVNILDGKHELFLQYSEVTLEDLCKIVDFVRMSNKHLSDNRLSIEIYCRE